MTDRDRIAQLEIDLLNRDFLPYSIGTPSPEMIEAEPYKRANLLFFTDSHIDFVNPEDCMENLRRTVDYINTAPVRFDAVVHGGDIITPFGRKPKEEAYARAERFFNEARRSTVPFIFTKGNHDMNDWDNLPENVLDDRDFGKLFLDEAEEHFGLHRQLRKSGVKSVWHYYDIPAQKIRIAAIDTQDVDKTRTDEAGNVLYHGGKAWGLSQEQMDWVIGEVLNFDDKEERDWGVIFVMHMGTQYDTFLPIPYENSIQKLICLCAAFNQQGQYQSDYDSPEDESFTLHISADFSRYASGEKRPHMICWLLGHNHVDKCEIKQGIPMIFTANASCTECSSDERLVRIPGTSTQNCFDIVNIDTKVRRIRMFRCGAGVNCYGIGGHRFLPDGLPY